MSPQIALGAALMRRIAVGDLNFVVVLRHSRPDDKAFGPMAAAHRGG